MRSTHVLAVLLLMTPLLAGCLFSEAPDVAGGEGERPVAVLQCLPQEDAQVIVCNQQMTPDAERSANEVTIAVNPTDPRNIVGGAKDYHPPDAGECTWAGVYVTHDGGATYDDRSLEGSPRRLLDGDASDFQATYASQYWCTTDPVVTFGPDGTLYYLFMAYQGDPVTASRTGEGTIPRHVWGEGAVNDWALNRGAQVLAVSSDGGTTFDRMTPIFEGVFPVSLPDKGWISIGPTGTIHVLWLAIFVPGNQYCRSTDDGRTFDCTGIHSIQFVESGQGSFLTAGTKGQVHAFWVAGDHIAIRRSLDDGQTWSEIEHPLKVHLQAMPGLSPRDHRDVHPFFAIDANPESPHADTLYAAWSDGCQEPLWSETCSIGPNNIYLAASTDDGRTWSTPIRVNDDTDGERDDAAWQIFPTVSVSPGGVVDVSWVDTRGTRGLTHEGEPYPALEQYYSYSTDGGKTWSENLKVRDVDDGGWDPALSLHQNGMVFIGDYNDIDSSWGAAHPVWPDTRHGHADVFTAIIQRPLFADAWGDEDQARLLRELVDQGSIDADHPFI